MIAIERSDIIDNIQKEFWLKKIVKKDKYIRIRCRCYYIDEKYNASKGIQGTKYAIKFFDGKKITTTDLWHCGKIPEEFEEELCDNAEFV